MYRAVIFDLFETLITEWACEKFTKSQCAALLGVDAGAFSAAYEAYQEEMYTGGIEYIDAVARACGNCGAEPGRDALDEVRRRRIATKSACFAVPYPERDDMLRTLRWRGLKLAILSNCSSEEVTVLRSAPFVTLFDAVVLSYETGLRKPDPAIYRLACGRLGVSPEDCLFVGDGGSRELYGAREAGMDALRAGWFLRGNEREMPFETAEQFPDVPERAAKGG